ncbi:hypothetical protein [Gloeobacter violaceus]|uniref:Glr4309 protein n=1 Tax=Gloeobacter violaceus (strain ATCC 29082 / PCC 7421) TaxID=251221 RepID=Q7NDC6_GLOVI|nr:hypothetical protein [Gloeobacter violaceus]BAC92250.1 glr4309 [Gloeobacter violaceus PCC 7421]
MLSALAGRVKRLKDTFLAYLELSNRNHLALLDATAYIIEVLQLQNRVFLDGRTELNGQMAALGEVCGRGRSPTQPGDLPVPIVVWDADAPATPEAGFFAHLAGMLPDRRAVAVGTPRGEVLDWLQEAGFAVTACSGAPEVTAVLAPRQSERHAYPAALPGRAALQHEGGVPRQTSLVHIDTGSTLFDVLEALEGQRFAVISAALAPGVPGGPVLGELVGRMRRGGYPWHLVLYRLESGQVSFYCNSAASVPGTWGYAFFFAEHETYWQARRWCSALLSITHFKGWGTAPDRA